MGPWRALGHCGSVEVSLKGSGRRCLMTKGMSQHLWCAGGGWGDLSQLSQRTTHSEGATHPVIHYIKFMVCLDSSGTTNKRRKQKRSRKGWTMTLGQPLQSPFPGSLWHRRCVEYTRGVQLTFFLLSFPQPPFSRSMETEKSVA